MSKADSDLMASQRELDLRSLILLGWSMRVPLLCAFVIVTLGYWGYWLASHDASEAPTYSRVVQFTFDGVEDGRYPNGQPFYIGDLVTADLISALYDMHGLGERAIAQEAFANAFAIEPYSPAYRYILNRGEQLAARGSPAELVILQEQLTAELRRAGRGAARLSFRPLSPLPLAEGDIAKLLLDLPKYWAKQAVEQYDVFGPNVPLHSPSLFDVKEIGSMEYLSAVEAIRSRAGVFSQSVEAMMTLPHANRARDPQTDTSLLDVRETVRALLAGDVQRLWADIVQLGVAKDRGSLIREYEYRVGELGRVAGVAAERVTTLQRALGALGRTPIRAQPPAELVSEVPSQAGLSPAGTLARELLVREEEAVHVALDLASQRAVLEALKRRAPDGGEPAAREVRQRLGNAVAVLNEQANVVQRIHALLRRGNFGAEAGLYRVADGGLIVTRPPTWRPRDVYIYLLLVFAATTAVLIVGSALDRRRPDSG